LRVAGRWMFTGRLVLEIVVVECCWPPYRFLAVVVSEIPGV
jgi:hypothetical protein